MAITTTWEDYKDFIEKERINLYTSQNEELMQCFFMFCINNQLIQLNDTLCYIADSIGDRLLQGEINYDN